MKCLFLRIKNLPKVQAKCDTKETCSLLKSTSLLNDGYYKG